ncbi:MAG: TetR/AcrR family transcriptional regulator [Phenylobacterium zucineum]|nr:MAG: TetR/AcrR family transcriptional regulator [Phenylobacterium zucineum]
MKVDKIVQNDAEPPPLRPDVARRRQALLDAAARVFDEQGVAAPLDAVLAAAGVGRGTLYRHFSDRTALLLGLLGMEVDRLRRAAEDGPPDDALVRIFQAGAERAHRSAALSAAWRAIPESHPGLRLCRARLLEVLAAPLAAAHAAGVARPDLRLEDLPAVLRMISAGVRESGAEASPARVLDLVLNGVLAGDAR